MEVLAPRGAEMAVTFEAHHRHIFDKCLLTSCRATNSTADAGLRESETLNKVVERLGTFGDPAEVLTHVFRTSGTATDVDQITVNAAKDAFSIHCWRKGATTWLT